MISHSFAQIILYLHYIILCNIMQYVHTEIPLEISTYKSFQQLVISSEIPKILIFLNVLFL
jgi:hypothetical protein